MRGSGRWRVAAMVGWSVVALPLWAEVIPMPGVLDPRVRVTPYDEHQVYRVQGEVGYALDVQFEAGEHFVGLATGDRDGVDFSAQGEHLFLKPKAAVVATNLTVLTDRRVYRFEYVVAEARDVTAPSQVIFALRFEYPAAAAIASPLQGNEDNARSPVRTAEPPRNERYAFCGAKELKPVKVWDDAVRTTLVFGAHQAWPAVFAVEADGSESLVNFTATANGLLLHRVSAHWVLRRGARVACLWNRGTEESGTATQLGGAP